MFAIVSTYENKRYWLSGVFETASEAEAEIARITRTEKTLHCLKEIDIPQFPVFVIEDHGFTFGGIELVEQNLSSHSSQGNDDFCHFNIFLISERYVPSEPGCDEMGMLMHWHVTDDYLRSANRNGFVKMLLKSMNDT